MLVATAALDAYIAANRSAALVDLYTFSLQNGGTLRYAAWTSSLSVAAAGFPDPNSLNHATGGTFVSGVRFGRSKTERKIGTDPTELDISVFPRPTDLIGSLTWQAFADAGGFDDATVELDRLVLPAGDLTDTALGTVIWFYGQVADVSIGRSAVQIKVKSLLNLLQIQQMPRRIYQAPCNHVFGGKMCGYDRVAGKNALGASTGIGATTVTAITGSSPTDIVVASGVAAYYGLGTCTCLTGANAGLSQSIVSVANPTVIGLFVPFPFAVAAGDTFQLLPGCDHTLNTCVSTFNNGAPDGGRFGGMPRIPPPEQAL